MIEKLGDKIKIKKYKKPDDEITIHIKNYRDFGLCLELVTEKHVFTIAEKINNNWQYTYRNFL